MKGVYRSIYLFFYINISVFVNNLSLCDMPELYKENKNFTQYAGYKTRNISCPLCKTKIFMKQEIVLLIVVSLVVK